MDMEEAEGIFRYLQRHPSVHELMAAWVGWKAPQSAQALAPDDPSVRIGNSIMASIDAAKAAAGPQPGASEAAGLPQMFPGGQIRI